MYKPSHWFILEISLSYFILDILIKCILIKKKVFVDWDKLNTVAVVREQTERYYFEAIAAFAVCSCCHNN